MLRYAVSTATPAQTEMDSRYDTIKAAGYKIDCRDSDVCLIFPRGHAMRFKTVPEALAWAEGLIANAPLTSGPLTLPPAA